MASEIVMPKLSDTMTEGELGVWRKSVGDRIDRGDIIAEVETDKAVMELEAFASGILLEQRVTAGETVAVGTVIGLIGTADEFRQKGMKTPPPGEAAVPVKEEIPAAEAAPVPAKEETAPAEAVPVPPPAAPVERVYAPGVQAAPVVRRRAAELGIDLSGVTGSGPGGRIMLEDLQRLSPSGEKPGPVSAVETPEQAESRPSGRMRSAIARTTVTSWQTIPHFYLTREMDMKAAEDFVRLQKSAGNAASLNGVIMAAVVGALRRFPELNAAYFDDHIVSYPRINLGFAVSLPEGLQVPVIREAETKTVRELSKEAATLAERARQGLLKPDDISGGSFSVSNLGMHGVDSFSSIIMPGQAGILAFGTVADRPAVRDKQLVIARLMTATLSCDHRLIDGTTAAAFINECRRFMEHPRELPL